MTDDAAYQYVALILRKRFSNTYRRLYCFGMLRYEVTNIIELCSPLFKGLTADDRYLENEIIYTITSYFQELEFPA